MKESVKSKSISKTDGKPYSFKDVCLKFSPGSHYLLSSSEKSELNRFGVGICLYFKLIKHLSLYFFIFTLLSIPALIFYTKAYHQFSENADDMGYLDFLTSTSLGSLGLGWFILKLSSLNINSRIIGVWTFDFSNICKFS